MSITEQTLRRCAEWIIVWIFLPCVAAMFILGFMGDNRLILFPLLGVAAATVSLAVIYIWRQFAPKESKSGQSD